MDTARLVLDIGVVLLLAAAAGWAARLAGLPAVIGYLSVGLLVSPFTPGYVADREQIELLADIGVVLLLFEVGIEVDLLQVRRENRAILWLAPLQVLLTSAIASAALLAAGLPRLGAALVGLSLAMSSSVVVVNITRSRRGRLTEETRRALLGWSVVQDVSGIVLAAVVLAALSGDGRPLPIALGALVVFAALAVLGARLLPPILRALRDQHDLFLIVSVGTGLAVAAAGAVVFEVPMALAAFIAGLALAEEAETAEARRRLRPFRDLFAVLFFVAVGMLIDPSRFPAGLPFLAFTIGAIVLVKIAPIALFARAARLPAQPLQLGVGLGQVGEFSYVLGGLALRADAITPEQFAGLLSGVVVTIAASAVLVRRIQLGAPKASPPSSGVSPHSSGG